MKHSGVLCPRCWRDWWVLGMPLTLGRKVVLQRLTDRRRTQVWA